MDISIAVLLIFIVSVILLVIISINENKNIKNKHELCKDYIYHPVRDKLINSQIVHNSSLRSKFEESNLLIDYQKWLDSRDSDIDISLSIVKNYEDAIKYYPYFNAINENEFNELKTLLTNSNYLNYKSK
jgi:predicted Holliday junction resolvase-like endonuclease